MKATFSSKMLVNFFKTTYGHILDDSSVKVRIFFPHTITLCLIKNGLTHSDLMQLSIHHKLIMGPAIYLIFLMKVYAGCLYAHNDGTYWAKVIRPQEKIIVFQAISKCVNSLDSATQMNNFNDAGGRISSAT